MNIPLQNQQISQAVPYNPYFYMNSQYPFGVSNQMTGINPGMNMNMMGYNFDSMSGISQMNMPSNFENFNQKK